MSKKRHYAPTCDYCHRTAELVNGYMVYERCRPDLKHQKFWRCKPCEAWVGCHPGSAIPMGRLANAELRKAKQAVHRVLDPLWKSGAMSRNDAYKMLAQGMGIAIQNCHVGMFDVPACETAVAVLKDYRERRDFMRAQESSMRRIWDETAGDAL